MSNEPDILYAVVNSSMIGASGEFRDQWLVDKYGRQAFGLIQEDHSVVMFYDEGHRDEFMKVFGGLKATARREGALPGRKLIGAH